MVFILMDRVKPKTGAMVAPNFETDSKTSEADSHQEIDSKATVKDLKELAVTLFSKKNACSSKHYVVLNALFEKPESQGVIVLIQRVMHVFLEEQKTLQMVQTPPQKELLSFSSYDKKSNEEELSLIYAGALSTIQDFLDQKISKLPFHDYTFELRMSTFSELNAHTYGLLKTARERALQAFNEPALLLVRIQRLYIEVMVDGDTPFLVQSSYLSYAKISTRLLDIDTKLPEFNLFYEEALAQELAKMLGEKSDAGKKDDIVESTPVISSNDLMFEFDDDF